MKPVASLSIGAGAFAVAQGIWSSGHAFAGWRGAWMLKSPAGIAFCLALVAIISAVACAYQRKPNILVNCAVFVWLGAVVAMAVALMIIGPGNLWPLVIAFDSVMIGAAVATGAVFGFIVSTWPKRVK
jgi:hypothetical protein